MNFLTVVMLVLALVSGISFRSMGEKAIPPLLLTIGVICLSQYFLGSRYGEVLNLTGGTTFEEDSPGVFLFLLLFHLCVGLVFTPIGLYFFLSVFWHQF